MAKVFFCSSSGGHYEQLRMLQSTIDNNESLIITEKIGTNKKNTKKIKYLYPVNRKERLMFIKMFINFILSLYYFLKYRPDIVISTGTLVTIPMLLLAKLFGKKTMYIESYAKVLTPTKTGKFLYGRVDTFIIQWEEMKIIYPEAIYLGGVY